MRDINNEIVNLWKNMHNNGDDLPNFMHKFPLVYPSMIPEAPLFIGHNPSYNIDDIVQRLQLLYELNAGDDCFTEHMNINFEDLTEQEIINYLRWNGQNIEQRIAFAICEFISARRYHNYFNNFKYLAEVMGFNKDEFNYIDLFLVRHTSAKDVQGFLQNNEDFKNNMIDIAINIIETIKPPIILIANTEAANSFKEYCKHKIKDAPKLAHHFFCLTNDKQIPIFFSSILYRHLDRHSKERLTWQMKNALK